MTKTRSTKSSLVMSALALFLCFTMLLGTTYAWFTDSVTSAGNKIVAGTLDVDLYLWNSADESVEITETSAPIFGEGSLAQNNKAETLWEPGKTQVAYLSIKNNGNLDLKYKVALEVYDETNNLLDVLSYTITNDAKYGDVAEWAGNGVAVQEGTNPTQADNVVLKADEEHFFALSIHMDENAGNDYQNGSATFDIKVLATQLDSESDSFDNKYDEEAVWAEYYVSSTEELNAAVSEGGTIALMNDINLVPVSRSASAANSIIVPKGVSATINLNGFDIVGASTKDSGNQYAIQVKGDLTIMGEGTVCMEHTGADMGWSALTAAITVEGGTLTLGEGVTVVHKGGSSMAYAVDVNSTLGATTLNIDGATLSSSYIGVRLFNNNKTQKATVNLNSGIVDGNRRDIWVHNPSANAVDTNGIVNIADTYTVTETVQDASSFYGRIYDFDTAVVGTADDLNNAIKNGNKNIYLLEGEFSMSSLSGKEGITIIGTEGTVIGGENTTTGFGSNFGKNTTIKNVTFSGTTNGVRYSYAQGGTSTFENCTFAGDSTYGFHIDQSNGATFIFNNCTFIGFNAFAGDLEKIEFNNCTFLSNGNYGNTNVWNVAYYNNCTWGEGAGFDVKSGTEIYVDGVRAASNETSIKELLAADEEFVLMKDVTFTGVKQTPDRNNYVEVYGNKVGFAQYSGVFDGNNHTLIDSEGDKSYVFVTHGGTIKNVTIKSGARGIVTYAPTEDVYIDNVVVDGAGYALNSTEHAAVDMFVTNSTINGWTSLAGFNSVNFTDCKLGENSLKYWQSMGYDQDYDRLFRVYSATTFTDCEFEQGYYLDMSAGGTATLTNCEVNGVMLTADNYAEYITIEIPEGKTLADCVMFN